MPYPTHGDHRTINPASFGFTALLGLFAALPALSIDMSAPTLLLLPAALGTTMTVAGLTLSMFMAGFAMGQLGGGRLSDGVGRRPVLIGGLACYTVAGIACTLVWSGPGLVACRMVQGVGAGACSVMAFAMVQDLFEGEAARSKRAYVTVVFGVVPVFAPAMGAVLSELAGWRAVHGLLALAGAGLLALSVAMVAETRGHRPVLGGVAAANGLLRDRRFVALTVINALSYSVVFAYIAGGPIVMMGQLGLTPGQYALVFACTATALTLGAWTGGWLARHGVGAAKLLTAGLAGSAVAALGLAAVSEGPAQIAAGAIPLMVAVMFARGVVAPNLQQLAVERQGARAGAASAMVGVSQLTLGAVSSAAVLGLLPGWGPIAVAGAMVVLGGAALVLWLGLSPSGAAGSRS